MTDGHIIGRGKSLVTLGCYDPAGPSIQKRQPVAQIKSPNKSRKKPAHNTVGYGILALYAAVLVLGGLGVYGWTFASVFPGDSARTQGPTGRMLFATDDRVRCRSYTFDNETAQLTPRGIIECDERQGSNQMGASFGVFQDSFSKRGP
jgi:hypothetical protein